MAKLILLVLLFTTTNSFAHQNMCFNKEEAIKIMKSNLEAIADGSYIGNSETSIYVDHYDSTDHFDNVLLNPSNISFSGTYTSSYEDFFENIRIDISLDCQGNFNMITSSYDGD